jgi:deoxyadenosine/deoxycytidine kinase
MSKKQPQSHYIVIAGNIGSGKTTLTDKLCKEFGWKSHFESVDDNPYLSDFYQDMNRWSFALQVYFLSHRFNVHREILQSHVDSVQDRSIYEDAHIFARALYEQKKMDERDYKNYLNLFKIMMKDLATPTLVVYLQRSVPKLVERIKLRGRDYEKSISVEYLTQLNTYYEEWFHSYNSSAKILINTDNLDFVTNEEDFKYIAGEVVLGGNINRSLPLDNSLLQSQLLH